ncbi:dihydrofolate reductase [Anaerococcus sp. mt242]|uniref:dihydrofolate reductase n=1 Tax=unclassified Anaerococcus TaxID=2614126 RepID=UPI001934B041|nr:dihydrofolate reductase [Anaerococcus sp. mt242]MBM0046722.1 dihydrofolate reductase [Anaerococcus sp. mt242]
MKIILAVDENWGIGKDNEMLFHIKKDLKHFKDITTKNIVIMGRNTYESMGQSLPDRENIILSKNPDFKAENAKIFQNPDQVLNYIKDSKKEVFVIGGAKIVEIFLPYCNQAIITKIKAKKDADTYLHNFDQDPDFEIIKESQIYEENGIEFSYVTYRRR